MFIKVRNVNVAICLCALSHILDASVINVATTLPPNVEEILKNTNGSQISEVLNKSRRIINGQESNNNRPYMVYLQLPMNNPKYRDYRRWLCGGVIIHEEYILTSAACIEDARNFYVVSGTFKHSIDSHKGNNLCIKNGAKKAIWKCVPRNYVFDGHENDNIRWMNNDIAVVKVEDEFDFQRRIKGCDYVPKPICYNNQSATHENPGTPGLIAGWGSTLKYNDWVNSNRRDMQVNILRETEVITISKKKCRRRWGPRYYNIIDNYMICTKDLVPDLSDICEEKYVDCTDVMTSQESGEKVRRVINPKSLVLHSPYHNSSGPSGRRRVPGSGGFCENDHGGPLVVDSAMGTPLVVGIISACLVHERTNKCYGPFLYTSVYKNRVLLNCAIYKNKSPECSKMYRSSITHTETVMSWVDHPDGPAKNEIAAMRRMEEEKKAQEKNHANRTDTAGTTDGASLTVKDNTTSGEHVTVEVRLVKENSSNGSQAAHGTRVNVDRPEQHEGIVFRSVNEKD